MAQYICHCDDCQVVHGKAYAVALYPTSAVAITRGETTAFTLKTSPRTRCSRCATYLFAEAPGNPFRGVNGNLLPDGRFNPEFHVQCRFAAARIEDELPQQGWTREIPWFGRAHVAVGVAPREAATAPKKQRKTHA
jgi:hypothetical protein